MGLLSGVIEMIFLLIFLNVNESHLAAKRINIGWYLRVLKYYKINGLELQIISTVKDLCGLLSSDLKFNTHISHIDAIYSKALRAITFLKQNCSKFI